MFFTYLRRELRRRRKAALVVALGLALGIGLVITVSSVADGMKDAQDDVLHSLYGVGTDITVSKEPAEAGKGGSGPRHFTVDGSDDGKKSTSTGDQLVPSAGSTQMEAATVGEVTEEKGVAAATGALALNDITFKGDFKPGEIRKGSGGGGSGDVGGPGAGGSGGGGGRSFVGGGGADVDIDSFTVTGVDVTRQDLGPLSSSKTTKGASFTDSDTDARKAVVDSAYAKDKDLAVGDEVTVKGKKFTVIGIATADTGAATANVYIPLKQAQTLADIDMKDKVSTVYVKAASSEDIPAVKSALSKKVDGATVTSASDLAEQVSGNLSTASDLANNVGRWLSAAVLAAAFVVAGLLTMSAVSRRVREFGTLKAVGWRSGRVVRQVMGEAFVNGLIGGVLGIGVGLLGAYVVTAVAPRLSATTGGSGADAPGPGGGPGGGRGGGLAKAFGGAEHTVDIALKAPVSVSVIVIAVVLAVAGGIIAGCFGGWRAARLRPADALRRVE
ncbi:ABC transporter permease [Streptomyces sp. NPDC050560]|uniref:ABC transporter permease n=1 Tax=Streptomyces sp. NPDC050560 TaxID=3365630 RepID=UPI0037BABF66